MTKQVIDGKQAFQLQADKTLSQDNPVTDTLYTVLATTPNCRILSATINITWAVTQPTNLRLIFTIDGQTIIHTIASPVSATNYAIKEDVAGDAAAPASQLLAAAYAATDIPIMYEGRSVKVEAAVTWGVTQPTPMVVRIKYAKIP